MKITRAIIINVLLSVGASIAPRPSTIKECDWRDDQPRCLTDEDGWSADKNYEWVQGNSFPVGPEENPYFKIDAAPKKNQFCIHNISGLGRFCVIKRLENPQCPWLQFYSHTGSIHIITGSPVTVYYKK
jgi:hypothetical protein